MDILLWATGIASAFMVCASAVYKLSDGPVTALAMEHLDIAQSGRRGIGGIELASGLTILGSVMMPTALMTSFALWAGLSAMVTSLLLAVGLTRAKQPFSKFLITYGVLATTTIFFALRVQIS